MAWGSPKLLACQPVIYAKVYAKREGVRQRERGRKFKGRGAKKRRKLAWNVAKLYVLCLMNDKEDDATSQLVTV